MFDIVESKNKHNYLKFFIYLVCQLVFSIGVSIIFTVLNRSSNHFNLLIIFIYNVCMLGSILYFRKK